MYAQISKNMYGEIKNNFSFLFNVFEFHSRRSLVISLAITPIIPVISNNPYWFNAMCKVKRVVLKSFHVNRLQLFAVNIALLL